MKKSLKFFTALTMVFASFSQIPAVKAEAEYNAQEAALEAETEIHATIEQATIVGGEEEDGESNIDEEIIDENAGENDTNGNPDDNGSFGDARLAIWRKPTLMRFKGKFSPTLNYELKYQPNTAAYVLGYAEGTDLVEAGVNSETIGKATEIGKKSMISVADVRSDNGQWSLNVKLPELKKENEVVLNPNEYEIKADVKAYRHHETDKKVSVYQFEKSDGKYVDPLLKTKAEKNLIAIANGEADKGTAISIGEINNIGTGETNHFAISDSDSNAKGYTAVVMENMKMIVEKDKGGSDSKHTLKGNIEWKLSAGNPVSAVQ